MPGKPDTRSRIPCRSCGEKIVQGVLLCHFCSSYQTDWRNQLRYWSGITSLFTLISSGLAVTIAFAGIIYERLSETEIAVTELVLFGDTAIWNKSSTDMLITGFSVAVENPKLDLQWDINASIEPKKVDASRSIGPISLSGGQITPLRVRIGQLTKDQWHRDVADWFDEQKVGPYAINMPAADLDTYKQSDQKAMDSYVPDFMSTDGLQYRQLKRYFGKQISEISATCSIDYVLFGQQSTFDVPCVGVMRHRT
jgi:hypothetical protein